MMAFCSLEVYYLEHVLLEAARFLKMMAFCSIEVYYLGSEHVLPEVVSILKDDGVLLNRIFLRGV
jgi:hypothetical protein